MIEKDLKKFIDNLQVTSKEDFLLYEDEKGNMYFLPKTQCIVGVEYNEFTDEEMEILRKDNTIPKEMEFNKIKVNKIIPKNKITGKEKDKNTLVEQEVEVNQVWFVKNALKMHTTFNNKEEAKAYFEKVNKILDMVI